MRVAQTATVWNSLANYEFSDQFSLFASYAWNRGRFGETDGDGNPQRFADNQFRLAPDHSFALGADVSLPVADGVEFFFRPQPHLSKPCVFHQ